MAAWLLAGLAVLVGAPLGAGGDPIAAGLVAIACIGILLVSLRAGPARLVDAGDSGPKDLRLVLLPEREGHRAGGEDNPIVLTVIRR